MGNPLEQGYWGNCPLLPPLNPALCLTLVILNFKELFHYNFCVLSFVKYSNQKQLSFHSNFLCSYAVPLEANQLITPVHTKQKTYLNDNIQTISLSNSLTLMAC